MTNENTTYPESSQATTAFILGLLSLVFGILAPFAWYIGSQELKAMDAGRRDPKDRSLAQAGKIIGMVLTILFLVFIAVGIVVLVIVLAVTATSSGAFWIG
jgi:cytochrome c oxidase assembly factor CtaG